MIAENDKDFLAFERVAKRKLRQVGLRGEELEIEAHSAAVAMQSALNLRIEENS